MRKRIISLLLALCLIAIALPLNVFAAEEITYSVKVSKTNPSVGEEFDIVIGLTNYNTIEPDIRGIQIDVNNVDLNIFEVISFDSLINVGTASHQPKKNLLRYAHLDLQGGYMDRSITDIVHFRLKIRDDLTENGSITLPVVLKIVPEYGYENVTLKDSITINYTTDKPDPGPDPDPDTVSVDVTWGSMEFVYDDGTWDKTSHKRSESGWKPVSETSNVITAENTGTTDVKLGFAYTAYDGYNGLTGNFTDGDLKEIASPVELPANGTKQRYRFMLSGKTENRWTDFVPVGKITVTITQ